MGQCIVTTCPNIEICMNQHMPAASTTWIFKHNKYANEDSKIKCMKNSIFGMFYASRLGQKQQTPVQSYSIKKTERTECPWICELNYVKNHQTTACVQWKDVQHFHNLWLWLQVFSDNLRIPQTKLKLPWSTMNYHGWSQTTMVKNHDDI